MATDPNAPLTKQDILDAIAAAGTNQGRGIGLAKGQKQIGITGASHTRGGAVFFPADQARTPADTYTQYGTAVHPNPYQAGDEQAPGGGDSASILQMQQRLIQAGLLKATDVRPGGLWDAKSANAYKIVLAYANVHAMSATDALAYFQNNPAAQAGYNEPAPTPLTNPLTAESQVRGGGAHQTNTARDLLGKDLSPAEAQDFAAKYQAQEIAARKSFDAANLAGKPTSQAPPNLGAAADDYIKQNHLADSVAYGTASRMYDFFNMLKGPV